MGIPSIVLLMDSYCSPQCGMEVCSAVHSCLGFGLVPNPVPCPGNSAGCRTSLQPPFALLGYLLHLLHWRTACASTRILSREPLTQCALSFAPSHPFSRLPRAIDLSVPYPSVLAPLSSGATAVAGSRELALGLQRSTVASHLPSPPAGPPRSQSGSGSLYFDNTPAGGLA